ncbi:hypothetical protein ACVNPS_08600 [Candidatus Bipolaricaulota sp. J31]
MAEALLRLRGMRVIGIVGSPRRGGNTDLLVERVLDGAMGEEKTKPPCPFSRRRAADNP